MQQVNLYTEELKPKRILFNFRPCAYGVGGLVLVLIALGVLLQFRASAFEQELRDAQQREMALQEQVESLQGQVEGLVQDPLRLTRNREQEYKLASRKELLSAIQGMAAESRPVFSELLKGLARQSESGLWLTSVGIHQDGSQVRLEGAANSAEAVPAYLSRLRSEPSFRGRTFNLLAVEPAVQTGQLAFSLSTTQSMEVSP